MNAALVEQKLTHATFATAVYGMVNASTLECRFAGAGHPHPLLMRADGTVMNVECVGGLLGIFPEERYVDSQIQLRVGDRLFVYTDGIEVAFGDDQCNNTEQWRTELERRRDMPIEQLLCELSDSLDKETGSLQPKDDVSIVVMEVK